LKISRQYLADLPGYPWNNADPGAVKELMEMLGYRSANEGVHPQAPDPHTSSHEILLVKEGLKPIDLFCFLDLKHHQSSRCIKYRGYPACP
jgi:hypothetical protein